MKNKTEKRKPEYRISRIFWKRWSPRAMSPGKITDIELFSLFEAARWAPSSFNEQPWNFVYGKKNTKEWKTLFDLLSEHNKIWAKKSSVLVVIISKKKFTHNGKPNPTHSFDTGAAWMSIALQGFTQGLAIHGMAGFDYKKAKKNLKVSDVYKIEAMFAVGKPGKKEDLPAELQKKETPSQRKHISDFIFRGAMNIK